jgi:FKBP-type peptidyl-prolyl cis-trans isomerase 2
MSLPIEPGMRVRLPEQPDWGEGQVQSIVGTRVTVNFEHAGKKLIETSRATLELVEEPRP